MMTMSFKLVIIIFNILLIAELVKCQTRNKCTVSDEKKNDINVQKLLTMGNSGRKFPENHETAKPYCR